MKAKPLKNLTIDRRRWKRGNPDDSTLLTETGQMCCLGFLGRACGLSPDQLRQGASPKTAGGSKDVWPSGVIDELRSTMNCPVNSAWTDNAIFINDADEGEYKLDREYFLKQHFKKIGINLRFK